MRSYDIGDKVRLGVTFTDEDGIATDPTAITALIRRPNETVTTLVYLTDLALARDSAGAYHVDVTIADGDEGLWWYRFQGTGTLVSAVERSFFVRASVFA